MNSAPSCQVADILIMAEEYVEGNCGGLDLMSEVRVYDMVKLFSYCVMRFPSGFKGLLG